MYKLLIKITMASLLISRKRAPATLFPVVFEQ